MNKEKFLPAAMIILCVCIALIFYNNFYAPTQTEIAQMQMNTRRLTKIAEELESFKRHNGDLEKFSALIDAKLKSAQNYLPAESMQENFVAELYRLAERNKILISNVQVGTLELIEGNSDSAENFSKLSVKVSFAADYIYTLKFISDILNGNRFVTIENFSLNDSDNIINGELELSIFSIAAPG